MDEGSDAARPPQATLPGLGRAGTSRRGGPVSAPGAALLTRPPVPGGGGRSLAMQLLLAVVSGGYAVGAALGWGSGELAEIMGDFGLSAAALLAAVSCYTY